MNTWVKELLKNLDDKVDEATRKTIMGACGEKCPFTHLPDTKLLEIKAESKNEKEFLTSLCNLWRLKNENGQYYVVFDQCYCPLVNENLEGTSQTLCFCTVGNIKHKFKIGLGREVRIEMQKTILAGDDECRFYIDLKNV
jgi:hypothetical protein